jgi:ribosomal protein L11 methyltransferase
VIDLEPGLSFGTGHHPTTRFCLESIVRFRPSTRHVPSFADVGTGSGLLAIAAVKLGYRPVRALDIDPVAIRVAQANARRNGVRRSIRFRLDDLRRDPRVWGWGQHDMVCANLEADTLIRAGRRLVRLVKPGGWLVLAGILSREIPAVAEAYRELGWVLARRRRGGEWTSGVFQASLMVD